jgi:hypothetical protein
MCEYLVSRTHYAGPSISIIANRVQAKGAQRIGSVVALAQHNCRTALAEQVSQLAAFADFREVAGQEVQFEEISRNQAGSFF